MVGMVARADMTDDALPPSPFVRHCLTRVRPTWTGQPAALDVAMGVGRHALLLAEFGFAVFGVDRNHERQTRARARLGAQGLSVRMWTADLEVGGLLPRGRFDLVVCTRYLQRTLWDELSEAVRPGGFVLYETFTTAQRRYDWGPRSPEYLLEPGELRRAFGEWEVWEYEECEAPAAEARLLARRPRPGPVPLI